MSHLLLLYLWFDCSVEKQGVGIIETDGQRESNITQHSRLTDRERGREKEETKRGGQCESNITQHSRLIDGWINEGINRLVNGWTKRRKTTKARNNQREMRSKKAESQEKNGEEHQCAKKAKRKAKKRKNSDAPHYPVLTLSVFFVFEAAAEGKMNGNDWKEMERNERNERNEKKKIAEKKCDSSPQWPID